jgi:membrane-associated phospholipid phosphatase
MLNSVRETIVHYDHMVWYYLNTQWHNAFFDTVIPFLRNPWFWAPLYLFLIIFMPKKFGKQGWIWCAGFLITFAISDQVSAHLMKPFFHRVRPCNNPFLADIVHIIVPCGSGQSFPSSHATNHFALAVFSAVSLGHMARWVWAVGLIWAASVSYAQVYVGVHFPFDVLCGGLLGATIGWFTGHAFNNRFRLA